MVCLLSIQNEIKAVCRDSHHINLTFKWLAFRRVFFFYHDLSGFVSYLVEKIEKKFLIVCVLFSLLNNISRPGREWDRLWTPDTVIKVPDTIRWNNFWISFRIFVPLQYNFTRFLIYVFKVKIFGYIHTLCLGKSKGGH